MSVLYRLLKEQVPISRAKRELSLRYGHFRRGPTGILDQLFERYMHDNFHRPMSFLDWVDQGLRP